MTAQRLKHIEAVVDEAARRASEERGAYLTEATGHDEALRSELEALVRSIRQ